MVLKRSFAATSDEIRGYYGKPDASFVGEELAHPKQTTSLIFRWYFFYSTKIALQRDTANYLDYQVHTGPALSAFNQ
jgi:trans-AT polyketide synthase/acyltransferase/oxidoreductase domain-containing protein